MMVWARGIKIPRLSLLWRLGCLFKLRWVFCAGLVWTWGWTADPCSH